MPVSAANSQLVFDALKASGVRLMSALPETWLVHLIRLADEDPDVTLVRLAKEEEGVGISMGAHLAGVAQRQGTSIFVSRGVGTVYVPVRVNCPPEVAVLTLEPIAPS